jgi:hypothetical protein
LPQPVARAAIAATAASRAVMRRVLSIRGVKRLGFKRV